MLIEFIKHEKPRIEVIRISAGMTILTNCSMCYFPIKAGDKYRTVCNKCGDLMTTEARTDHFLSMQEKYIELQ